MRALWKLWDYKFKTKWIIDGYHNSYRRPHTPTNIIYIFQLKTCGMCDGFFWWWCCCCCCWGLVGRKILTRFMWKWQENIFLGCKFIALSGDVWWIFNELGDNLHGNTVDIYGSCFLWDDLFYIFWEIQRV